MTQNVLPNLNQHMFGNTAVILRGARSLASKQLICLKNSAHSRTICWAPSLVNPRALARQRSSASRQDTNTPVFQLSDTALQQIIEAEGKILRYVQCTAVPSMLMLSCAEDQCKVANNTTALHTVGSTCTGASVLRQPSTQGMLQSQRMTHGRSQLKNRSRN